MTMRLLFWGFLSLLLAFGCTPKTTEKTVETEPEETPVPTPEPEEDLSPCPKFQDAPYPDNVETNYVLYRDFLRAGDYTKAYDLWKKVYEVAPAADGKRNTVMADGIFFYERLAAGESDATVKQQYIDNIFALYDQIDECYPEGGFVDGRKAFDLYYNYPDRASQMEVYELFKQSIEKDGMKTQDFVLNPFTNLLVQLYFDEKIDMPEAQKYQQFIRDRLAKGLEDCRGEECERWKVIEGYAPVRLEAFETEKGFYDCAYYKEKFLPEFEEAKEDCDVIRTVYSRLVWGDCPETDEKLKEIISVGNANCVEEKSLAKGYDALREARYTEAIDLFIQAAEEESDATQKAKINMTIAKVYYSHLRNFSKSRQYARIAADQRPNWGEPYLLIGRLYASSGPLCGPGRGWDSQIVVWPAIDMWNKAKRVDSAAAAEANKYINRYTQFMPSREDIFQRTLKEGDTFRVGCWIQETTVIRAAPY
jgi:hypothetical protein